jgi:hypothetical protein
MSYGKYNPLIGKTQNFLPDFLISGLSDYTAVRLNKVGMPLTACFQT